MFDVVIYSFIQLYEHIYGFTNMIAMEKCLMSINWTRQLSFKSRNQSHGIST